MHVQHGRYHSGIWNTCNGVAEAGAASGSKNMCSKMPGILKSKSQDVYTEMLFASDNNKLEMGACKKKILSSKSFKSSLSSNSCLSKGVKVAAYKSVESAPVTNCKCYRTFLAIPFPSRLAYALPHSRLFSTGRWSLTLQPVLPK